ncbi:hypothetical protein HOH45_09120, partial [bacterium]|nr:hypothetical protein [bacterium]
MDVIQETLNALPKDDLLHQFSVSYLDSIPPRTLGNQSPKGLAEFLEKRYRFFEESCHATDKYKIYSSDIIDTRSFKKQVFEFVCNDAGFLIMTFQSLFREFGLKITKLLHPVINAEVNSKGTLVSIGTHSKLSKNYSVTYIEFEDVDEDNALTILRTKIERHLHAVQESYRDSQKLLKKVENCLNTMKDSPYKSPEPVEEWQNLMRWLNEDNFSYFGYAVFDVTPQKKSGDSDFVKKEGLGILKESYVENFDRPLLDVLKAHVWKMRGLSTPYIFDSLKFKSPIQRFENLMRLSIKIKTKDGRIEDHNFVGLLRRSSLLTRNMDTPLIHLKMKYIFKQRNIRRNSFDEHEVIRIFNTIPKFELFRTPSTRLLHMVDDLFSITNPNEIYLFSQPRTEKKRLPFLVFIPPHLFNPENISRIQDYMVEQIPHSDFETIRIRGEESCRLHIYFEQAGNENWVPDIEKLAVAIRDMVKPWEERLKDIICTDYPGVFGKQLYIQYGPFFPTHYKVRRNPKEAVRDIGYLEKVVHEESMQFSLVPFNFKGSILSGAVSLLTIYNREKIDLIRIMPILQLLGLHVYDEVTTRIGTPDSQFGYIHSFRVTDRNGNRVDDKKRGQEIVILLKEVFLGNTENDSLNGLVLKTDLDWRLINVVSTYRNLFLQMDLPYSKERVNKILLKFPESTVLLCDYFETKFSTSPEYGKRDYRLNVLLPKIKQSFIEKLSDVKNVAEDAVLKGVFELIDCTVRTNFYVPRHSKQTFISVKLNPEDISIMPNPRPKFEIYVHDVGLEGTHLRFGSVARGGLRWSERPDDFRREVLGLVKTQQVKNAVIVPVGAKGGFVVKKTQLSRQEMGKEVKKQYTKFIEGLLDITDTIDESGQIRRPNYVISYDQPDPYMVVAADKGTAAMSDTANGISQEYKFWLGDAFASGGSDG